MAAALDSQRLGAIFQARPDILDGIKRAADSPSRVALFNEIANHVYEQLHDAGEPAQKRRRLDAGQANGPNGVSTPTQGNAADEEVLLVVKEISVSAPQRKKFELCLTPNFLYARAPGTTAPIPSITYAWRDIEYAFYLPVPDKAQVQHNYVFFPKDTCLPSKTNPPAAEPLVFTVPATPPKEGTIGGSEAGQAAAVSDTYRSLFHWALGKRFRGVGSSVEVVSADPNKFHSVIRQAQRPNERAVHVAGFRGSKDGFLFFLENGILWGFKKPLIFIPLNRIAAISYTSILQITFNIVVEVFSSEGGDADEELEFGMLDQQDYGGIDEYIKRNRLQDRSMAEQRKGKLQLAENRAPKKEGQEGGSDAAVAEDGMTELQRAQAEAEQELQDDEDEDEEDYDPGSDAESGGSGSSDDDDDDDDEDDEDDEGDEDEASNGEGVQEGEDADEDPREDEEQEEEEEEQPPEPPRSKPQKPAVKKEKAAAPPAAVSNVPVRQGWATVRNPPSRRADDLDMDEEFDVVG
ncbi:hypothetical protein JDV02_002433 [Purpureocillium takamizusanense]|uniref:Histone chaperone RTT106/FACT complex subunit SPT16-like middle domain-containing protein n=1 Tax=Purpureocillium takamizusanense TaxID=2060973 RepID=A0A9Q8V8T7_9HYPO|nr:uncharacterized protein JDV02_002433 [Purpureocillium takamizusanense]UNI15951.1 hypothetical protein JDV02_002433 [Purpureocillium takamizusanense]